MFETFWETSGLCGAQKFEASNLLFNFFFKERKTKLLFSKDSLV